MESYQAKIVIYRMLTLDLVRPPVIVTDLSLIGLV